MKTWTDHHTAMILTGRHLIMAWPRLWWTMYKGHRQARHIENGIVLSPGDPRWKSASAAFRALMYSRAFWIETRKDPSYSTSPPERYGFPDRFSPVPRDGQ